MLLATALLVLLLGSVSSAGEVELPLPAGRDPLVSGIIARVTTETLVYELAGLTGERPVTVAGSLYTMATRCSLNTHEISMATRYAFEQLAALGLPTSYHTYTYGADEMRNVVAEKPGLAGSGQIYLLTAHIDDLPVGPLAPGADDNGTGSVAVMTAAGLLAPYRFLHTLRFVLFTMEEQQLKGSDAYAADCLARGENIAGVVNLDMIGYNTGAPVFDAYARSGSHPGAPESRELADVFSDVVGTYDLDLIQRRLEIDDYPLKHGSDQWSFLSRGYPAILIIQDYAGGDYNPHYHTAGDTLSGLDLDYYAEATRAAVATLAHLGRIVTGTGYLSGTVRAASSGAPLSATLEAFSPAHGYTFTTLTGVGGGYSLPLPTGAYAVTATPAYTASYLVASTEATILSGTTSVWSVWLALRPRSYLPLAIRNG